MYGPRVVRGLWWSFLCLLWLCVCGASGFLWVTRVDGTGLGLMEGQYYGVSWEGQWFRDLKVLCCLHLIPMFKVSEVWCWEWRVLSVVIYKVVYGPFQNPFIMYVQHLLLHVLGP